MSVRFSSFFALFGVFFLLYHSPFMSEKGRRLLLMLAANLAFILSRQAHSLLILLGLSGITFLAARRIELSEDPKRRRAWLALAVSACVLSLAISKLKSAWLVFGMSFYVFQMIGYVVDVERRRCPAEREFMPYLTALSSFLYLSAGPILRASDFLPQLASPAAITYAVGRDATLRIALGLAKKVIADRLKVPADEYFDAAHGAGFIQAWTAVLALAGQYYADFSGYSDIAIGLGALLGLRLPENFRTPYLATSVLDHWRRWHITLTEWFREYVFVPLCLIRWPFLRGKLASHGGFRISLSLLVALGLIGLWHGFTLSCFVWGIYNAVLVILAFAMPRWNAPKALRILFTFYVLALGRVLTRAETLSGAWMTWKDMHWHPRLAWNINDKAVLSTVLLGLIVPHALDWLLQSRPAWFRAEWVSSAVTVALMVYCMVFGLTGAPFLYEGF